MAGGDNGKGKGDGSITPHTLTSADNPGSLVTHVQMKGTNYEEWAKAMRVALRAKKKLGFVDGTVSKPAENAPDIEDWRMINSMIVAWIFNAIKPTLRSTITYRENAKDLWDDLNLRFAIANGPPVQQLKSELANCKQNGQSVASYFGKMKMLWDELNDYEPILACECKGCECQMTDRWIKRCEDERIH